MADAAASLLQRSTVWYPATGEPHSLCSCELLCHVKMFEMQIVRRLWHGPSAAASVHAPHRAEYPNSTADYTEMRDP
jgi:hypothetical protein